jgi:hypothetical protein
MHGSVVLKSGGTPGIESPSNAKAWSRTRSPAALALAQLARDEVHLRRLELDATSPQFAQDVRLILSADERAQTDGLYLEENRRRTFILVRGVLWTLSGPGSRPVALLLRSARETRLDLHSEGIHFKDSRSGNLVLLAFATPRSFGMLPS